MRLFAKSWNGRGLLTKTEKSDNYKGEHGILYKILFKFREKGLSKRNRLFIEKSIQMDNKNKNILKRTIWKLPGGPVVRTPSSHCQGPGSKKKKVHKIKKKRKKELYN